MLEKRIKDLTLTSVVFESPYRWASKWFFRFNFNKCCIWIAGNNIISCLALNLTLTSVVFECEITAEINKLCGLFNFNKCCIWIVML